MDSINKLIFFFLLFLSTSVYSSAQLAVDFKATSFQQLLKTDTGILSSTKFTGRNIAGRAVYGLRSVPLAKQIVGNVLKTRSFSPWGAAITVALTAAGYFINNNTQTVDAPAVGDSTVGSCQGTGDISTHNSILQECITDWKVIHPQSRFGHISGQQIVFYKNPTSTQYVYWWYAPSGTDVNSIYNNLSSSEATDEEVFDAVVYDFSNQDLSYALTDPNTGHPDKQLTPIVDAATDLTEDYDDANDSDTNTNPDTDNLYDTGDGTITENVDEIPSNRLDSDSVPTTSEQQDPCELNPDALGCQEFGDELTSVDIPTQELQFSFDPVVLTSNASCPAAQTLNLSFGVVTLENQPICDFMIGINPIVITVCSLLSLYLVVGGVKQNV